MTSLPNFNSSEAQVHELAAQVISGAKAHNIKICIAESLTGGMLCSALVAIPGASQVVLAGVVAYHDAAKHQILKVPSVTLSTFGAVSEETAVAMADGARQLVQNLPDAQDSEIYGISTTGVAGPDSQEGKPAGTAFIALALGDEVSAVTLELSGNRHSIQVGVVMAALQLILEQIDQ